MKIFNLIKEIADNNLLVLKYVWKYSRSYIPITVLYASTAIISPFTDTLAPKLIVDFLVQKKPFIWLLYVVAAIALVEIVKIAIYPWFDNVVRPKAENSIKGGMNLELMDKISSLDIVCYENPDFYDKYTRAVKEADRRALDVVNTIRSILYNLFYMGSLFALIFSLDSTLFIAAVSCMVIMLIFDTVKSKLRYDYSIRQTIYERRDGYIKRVFYELQYAKELRLFNIGKMLLEDFKENVQKVQGLLKKQGRVLSFLEFLAEFFRVGILIIGVSLYLIWKIYNGFLSPGDFFALFIATMQFSAQLKSLLSGFTEFYDHSMYINNLREVLDYEQVIERKGIIKEEAGVMELKDILIKNVKFQYAGQSDYTLKGINIKIRSGQKVAFVGRNGAGKSTLVKLLVRLYDPCSGEMLFDGKNFTAYDVNFLRANFGLIFQDFQYYAASIAENVLLHKVRGPSDEKVVMDALEKSGLLDSVSALKNGIHTMVSKEFDEDGIMLSGGEIQKLALARVFAKDSSIIILDEPSSALDPISEHNLYKNVMELADNKTVIFISHRLSTTKMADRIFFFENGMITEEGTHEELMQTGGTYAEMFNLQASKYIDQEIYNSSKADFFFKSVS
jgi:ATP-binding cassette subfamily B protein